MTKEVFKTPHINVLTHHESVHIPGCKSTMKYSFDLPTHVTTKKEKETRKTWSSFICHQS